MYKIFSKGGINRIRSSNPKRKKEKPPKRRSVLRMSERAYLSDAKYYAWDSRASEVILSNISFIGYHEPLKITSKEKS